MDKVKTIVDYYHEILNGKRKYFPMYTWDQSDSEEILIELTRYIINEHLKLERQDLIEKADLMFFQELRIGSAIRRVYKGPVSSFLVECFPEWDFKPWEFKKATVPKNYWNNETAVLSTKWLIEDILQWPLEKVQKEISNSYFLKYNLGGMIRTLRISATDAIIMTYPDYDWTYLKERRGYKLLPKQATEIRKSYKKGYSMHKLAKQYQVDVTTVFAIVHNRIFKEPVN